MLWTPSVISAWQRFSSASTTFIQPPTCHCISVSQFHPLSRTFTNWLTIGHRVLSYCMLSNNQNKDCPRWPQSCVLHFLCRLSDRNKQKRHLWMLYKHNIYPELAANGDWIFSYTFIMTMSWSVTLQRCSSKLNIDKYSLDFTSS